MSLFRTRDFGRVIDDAVFGPLRLDECNSWRGHVVLWGDEVELSVGSEPDLPGLGCYRDGLFRAIVDYFRFVRGAYSTQVPGDAQHAAWRAVLEREGAIRQEIAEAARQRLHEVEGNPPAVDAADIWQRIGRLANIDIGRTEAGFEVVFLWNCNWDLEHGFEAIVVGGQIVNAA